MTKVVCRLLDADNNLLGWTEIKAAIPGDGTLRASEPVVIVVEREGMPAFISHHWCDPNVEIRFPINAPAVFKVGEQHAMYATDAELFRVGPMPSGLPPVTMRSAVVDVPVGLFGMKT